MRLYKHTRNWTDPILIANLSLTKPESVLIDWHGSYHLATRELIENGLGHDTVYKMLDWNKDTIPISSILISQCIPVPQDVAKVLIEEYSLDHQK